VALQIPTDCLVALQVVRQPGTQLSSRSPVKLCLPPQLGAVAILVRLRQVRGWTPKGVADGEERGENRAAEQDYEERVHDGMCVVRPPNESRLSGGPWPASHTTPALLVVQLASPSLPSTPAAAGAG